MESFSIFKLIPGWMNKALLHQVSHNVFILEADDFFPPAHAQKPKRVVGSVRSANKRSEIWPQRPAFQSLEILTFTFPAASHLASALDDQPPYVIVQNRSADIVKISPDSS